MLRDINVKHGWSEACTFENVDTIKKNYVFIIYGTNGSRNTREQNRSARVLGEMTNFWDLGPNLELWSVFEKSANCAPSRILISRVPFCPACQDASFEWFPRSFGLMVWAPEPFFCKEVNFFPGSVEVFENSVNW